MSDEINEGIQEDSGSNVPEGDSSDPGSGDLEGLKKNRDSILKEKKALEAELKKLKAYREKEETERLEKEKKYQDLWEKEKAEKEKLLTSLKEKTQLSNLEKEARKYGFDTDYLDTIRGAEFDEEGNLTNGEDLFKGLKESKPKFFDESAESVVKIETSKTPINPGKGHTWTRAEIRALNPEEYRKYASEIKAQEQAGLVKEK